MDFLRIIAVSLLASAMPLLGYFFFGAEQNRGLISFDILFLLLVLKMPKENLYWKLFFACGAFAYAFFGNEVGNFATAGVYILLIFSISLLDRTKFVRIGIFSLFTLLIFIADAGNFFYRTYELSLQDAWGLAKFFWWATSLFFVLPTTQLLIIGFASKKRFPLSQERFSHVKIFIVLIIAIMLGYCGKVLQFKIPIVEFSLNDYMVQICSPDIIEHNSTLREDIKQKYEQIEIPTDQKKHPTVYILAESWGVFKNVEWNDWIFSLYNSVERPFDKGISLRRSSFTQSAELEDLLLENDKCLRLEAIKEHLKSYYIHGYEGSFYDRKDHYQDYGFDTLLFKQNFQEYGLKMCSYGFEGICDSSLATYIDSLLTDSLPKFVYWTTLDGHTPYDTQHENPNDMFCKENKLNRIECIYFERQFNTAKEIVKLVNKHPNYTFVIRGDHRPPGSLEEHSFVSKFYYRWVPTVIVNGI